METTSEIIHKNGREFVLFYDRLANQMPGYDGPKRSAWLWFLYEIVNGQKEYVGNYRRKKMALKEIE